MIGFVKTHKNGKKNPAYELTVIIIGLNYYL